MVVEFEEFGRVLQEVRSSRSVAGLPVEIQPFELLVASEEEVRRAEEALGVELPAEYRQFMTTYGGGQFRFLDLVPVVTGDARAEDLVAVNRSENIPAFVAVAPVGTGDWWGFEVQDGICDSRVSFWFHDDGTLEPQYADFFDFLIHRGLKS